MSALLASPASTVQNGALPLAVLFAVVAGVVSFASPCVFPLVPGFLAYVTGLSDERRRARLVLGASLFVAGFTVIFVSVQAAVSFIFGAVEGHRDVLMRIGGLFVVFMGLMFMGVVGQNGFTIRWRPAAGLAGAPLLGAVFALGMSPCLTPVLTAIVSANTALGSHGTPVRAIFLTTCYGLGMGLPFILIAAGWARAEKASRWLRDRHRPIQLFGGTIMVIMGVLMVSGLWTNVMSHLQTQLV